MALRSNVNDVVARRLHDVDAAFAWKLLQTNHAVVFSAIFAIFHKDVAPEYVRKRTRISNER